MIRARGSYTAMAGRAGLDAVSSYDGGRRGMPAAACENERLVHKMKKN
jgi:hypothetical protein